MPVRQIHGPPACPRRQLWAKPIADSALGDVLGHTLRQLAQQGQEIADTKKRQAHKVFILLEMHRTLKVGGLRFQASGFRLQALTGLGNRRASYVRGTGRQQS